MIIWIDAQLSPALPNWIERTLGIKAVSLRDVGLRDASVERSFERPVRPMQ